MNLCVDKLLLRLLPLERITGLSQLSLNPVYSGYQGHIPKHKTHRGQAEELVLLQPDLVIAGQFGANQAVATLRHLGINVETVALPRTLEESREFILHIGRLVNAEAAAEAYVQQQQQQMAAAREQVKRLGGQRTLLYSPNGKAIGSGTLEHTILETVGQKNAAIELGINGWKVLSLEELLLLQPDQILLTGTSRHFSMAQEILSHPILRERVKTRTMPEGLSVCPAIHAGELAQAMASQP